MNDKSTNIPRSPRWIQIFNKVISQYPYVLYKGYPIFKDGSIDKSGEKISPTFYISKSGRVWFKTPREGVVGLYASGYRINLPEVCKKIEMEVDSIFRSEEEEKRNRMRAEMYTADMRAYVDRYREQSKPTSVINVVKQWRIRGDDWFLLTNGFLFRVEGGSNDITVETNEGSTYVMSLRVPWDDSHEGYLLCSCPVGKNLRPCEHFRALSAAWNKMFPNDPIYRWHIG